MLNDVEMILGYWDIGILRYWDIIDIGDIHVIPQYP
jgi:hypothetical protein